MISPVLRKLKAATGALAAIFGTFALIGWALAAQGRQAWFEGILPMSPYSALCFILCGAAFGLIGVTGSVETSVESSTEAKARLLTRALVVVVIQIALACLVWQAFDGNAFGGSLGRLLPYPMATNASVAFLLLSAALFCLSINGAQGRAWQAAAGALSALAALLGLFALLDWAGRIIVQYEGARAASMAAQSGVLFVLMGSLCTIHAWREAGTPLAIGSRRFATLTLGLVVFAVLGFVSFESARRLEGTAEGVRHVNQALVRLEKVNSGLVGVQMSAGRYIITARPDYLAIYQTSLRELQNDVAGLRPLISDSPRQQQRLLELEQLLRQQVAFFDHLMDTSRQGSVKAAADLLTTGTGQELKTKILLTAGLMDEEERDVLAKREAQARFRWKVTFFILPAGTFAGLGLLLAGMTFLNSEATKRIEAETPSRLAKEIIRSTADAVITKTLDGVITSWNPGAEKIFGFTAKEAIGQSIHIFIPPERRSESAIILQRVRRGERVEHFETVRMRKDGSRAQVWVTVSPLRDHLGEVVGASKLLRDITQGKLAETALRESEQRLDFALRTSQIGAWELSLQDGNATRTLIHDRIFGYHELLPRWTYEMFLHHVLPEDRAAVDGHFQAATAAHGNWSCECRILRADGEVRWIWAAGGHEMDATGKAVRLSGIVQDISARKLAEEARRASEERYRTLFENAPDGILIADADSTHLDANASMCRMLGYSREELVGMHAADIQAPFEADQAEPALMMPDAAIHYPREWRFRRKDGTFFSGEVIATSMPGGDVVGMIRDITERKEAARALSEKDERLHATDRRLAEILNGMTEACFALDKDWRFTFVNDRVVTLLSREREEMLGFTIFQAFPQLLGTPPEQHYRRAMAERVAVAFEAFSATIGRWLDVRLFPTAEGLAAFLLDIDPKKRAEQAIATSESRYRRLFETAKDGILILDGSTGRVEDVNPFLVTMLGCPRESFLGVRLWEIALFKHLASTEEDFADLKSRGYSHADNLSLETCDGRRIDVEFVSSAYLVDEKEVVQCNLRDVTSRESIKVALRDSEVRFRTMANSIPQLAWIAHADGFIYWYNERWCQYTGTTPEQMEGWGWQSVHDPEMLPKVMEKWVRAIATGQPFEMEFPLRGADGKFRTFLTRIHPLRDTSGQVVQWFGTNTDVDDLKQMEASLRRSRARLNSALLAGAIGTWTWDIVNDCLTADEFTARAFSIPTEAAQAGLPATEYLKAVLAEDQPGVSAGLAAAIETCGHYDIEYRVGQPDGSWIWLQAKGRVEADATGKASLFHGAVIDITERKKTDGHLRRLVDSNAHGVMFWNTAGKIKEANDAFLHTVGYSRKDLEAGLIDWMAMTPPEYAALDRNSLRELAANGICAPFEKEYIRKDGSRVPVLLGAAMFDDSPGEGVCFLLDITERKQQDRALQESEEHFRFLNELSDATRLLSDAGQIMTVMVRMLGEHLQVSRCAYANVDADGERFTILHDYADGCPSIVGNYQLSSFGQYSSSTLHRGEVLIIRDVDAELLFDEDVSTFNANGIKATISCPLVKDGGLRALMAVHQTTPRDWKPREISIVQDVVERCWATIERRIAEEDLRRLNTELESRVRERTAELESANHELEAFSYSVSHDLRAPLRAVDGFSQAMVETYGPQLPEEGRRYLETIRRGAQRMGALIDHLLEFSRLSRQPLAQRPVETERLVREVLEEFSTQREGRHIEIRLSALPDCHGDATLLRQVWVNLISNALKYTGKRHQALVEIGCRQENGQRIYFVRDNGTGFDMKYAGKLFGVFQRLHRAEDYEGTGVGLAIVQRIVHRHGGRIWAEAVVDRGAIFCFTLI